MQQPVGLHDIGSIWSYVLIFLAPLPLCGGFAFMTNIDDAQKSNLVSLFSGLISAQGIIGIVIHGIGAFIFITRVHRHMHKGILAVGLSFFLFEIASLVRTYQPIHTLRLLNLSA